MGAAERRRPRERDLRSALRRSVPDRLAVLLLSFIVALLFNRLSRAPLAHLRQIDGQVDDAATAAIVEETERVSPLPDLRTPGNAKKTV